MGDPQGYLEMKVEAGFWEFDTFILQNFSFDKEGNPTWKIPNFKPLASFSP